MQPDILRKEPTIGPQDGIPVLNDRIPLQWEELVRVLRPFEAPGSPAAAAAAAPEPALRHDDSAAVVAETLIPAINEAVGKELDNMLTLALNNSYQRLRADLSSQLQALIAECVRKEVAKLTTKA